MIQVNLLPREERIAEPRLDVRMPRPKVWVTALIVCALIIPMGGLSLMQHSKMSSLRVDIAQAEAESKRLQPAIDRINLLMVEREALNLRLGAIQTLSRERYLAVEMLDELALQIPSYLWLTKVAESGPEQISVEGLTYTNLMVAELMSRMEESQLFDNVSLTVAEKSKEVSSKANQTVTKFTLSARVKP